MSVPPPVSPLDQLRTSLGAVLSGRRACLVVTDGAQRPVDLNPNLALVPASTQKLLVAAAALSVLGPGYRFHTTVVGSGPISDGSVDQLWLVGGGDPLLATPDYASWLATQPRYLGAPLTPLAALATQLRSAGLRRVAAGVHGDALLYSTPTSLAVWTPAEVAEGDAGSLGALTVDEGWAAWQPRYLPAPDPQIVAFMLASSDNTTAELLTLAVGLRLGGVGSTAAGTAGVLVADQRLGIPTTGLTLLDGSGLAPGDLDTCAALLAVLSLGQRPDTPMCTCWSTAWPWPGRAVPW